MDIEKVIKAAIQQEIEKEITKLFLRDKPFIKEGQSIKSAQKNWELAKKAIEGGKSNIQNVRKADKTAIFLNTPKVVKSKTSTPKVVKSKTSKTTKTSKSKSNISDENEEMFQSYLYMKDGGNINLTILGDSDDKVTFKNEIGKEWSSNVVNDDKGNKLYTEWSNTTGDTTVTVKVEQPISDGITN